MSEQCQVISWFPLEELPEDERQLANEIHCAREKSTWDDDHIQVLSDDRGLSDSSVVYATRVEEIFGNMYVSPRYYLKEALGKTEELKRRLDFSIDCSIPVPFDLHHIFPEKQCQKKETSWYRPLQDIRQQLVPFFCDSWLDNPYRFWEKWEVIDKKYPHNSREWAAVRDLLSLFEASTFSFLAVGLSGDLGDKSLLGLDFISQITDLDDLDKGVAQFTSINSFVNSAVDLFRKENLLELAELIDKHNNNLGLEQYRSEERIGLWVFLVKLFGYLDSRCFTDWILLKSDHWPHGNSSSMKKFINGLIM